MITAFQPNAFQNNAFQISSADSSYDVFIDNDDQESRRRDRDFRERRERLRADLLLAIDGPQATEAIDAVAPYVDGPVAAPRSIDYRAIAQQFAVLALIERAAAAKRAADDEDDYLLLSA